MMQFLTVCRFLLVIPVIGSGAYIAAEGLYKLFISNKEIQLPIRLKIANLNDLENKIIGTIVAALAVAFLGHAAGTYEPTKLLGYGGTVVVASLAFFTRQDGKYSSLDSEKWRVSGESVDAKASAEKSAHSWHNTQRPQSTCPSGSIGVLIKNNLKMKAPCFFNYFYWMLFSGARLDIDI